MMYQNSNVKPCIQAPHAHERKPTIYSIEYPPRFKNLQFSDNAHHALFRVSPQIVIL